MNTEALQTDIDDMLTTLAAIKGGPFARLAYLWMKVSPTLALVKQVESGKISADVAMAFMKVIFSEFGAEVANAHNIDPVELIQWADTMGAKAREHLKR